MRKEIEAVISSMTVYEKFELSLRLLQEHKNVYDELENVRHRADQYCQGMLLAKDNHGLNELVVDQLEKVKRLTDNAKYK